MAGICKPKKLMLSACIAKNGEDIAAKIRNPIIGDTGHPFSKNQESEPGNNTGPIMHARLLKRNDIEKSIVQPSELMPDSTGEYIVESMQEGLGENGDCTIRKMPKVCAHNSGLIEPNTDGVTVCGVIIEGVKILISSVEIIERITHGTDVESQNKEKLDG